MLSQIHKLLVDGLDFMLLESGAIDKEQITELLAKRVKIVARS